MLDIKRIAAMDPQEFMRAMRNRNAKVDVDALLSLEAERKQLILKGDALKARRNEVSAQIPRMLKAGEDTAALKAEMREAGDAIKQIDERMRAVKEQLADLALMAPNLPGADVPVGADETENLEQRKWGEPRDFDFPFQAHWDIGERLGILDFAAGAKLTGARFTVYHGLGARLERALVSFMLDTHREAGYEEQFLPFIANRDSMLGTGQLPKFAEDMFKLEGLPYYLIPTAEVPLTNLFRQSIIEQPLPIKLTAYSACFRAEAGSAGRDTRGLVRQHQFNKVEMVNITRPEQSYDALEAMTAEAELILQKLGLPYRVILLCTGDMGFSAAKTYDIEVWMPSYGRYVEISSCSNCEDFQARRAGIRFKDAGSKKGTQFAHTLNGSGLAVGRTVAALLENYQQADGSVTIPEVLIPYIGAQRIG